MFTPGDPWPGSPGGAANDSWSGYVRFWLEAQIDAGTAFRMGPDARDRLDSGNVMSIAGGLPAAAQPQATVGSHLWVDLTCDLIDCELTLGSTSTAGVLSKAEAGTLTATLYDPTGKYDPTNPDTVYALNHQTRLTPGVPVRAWCEVVTDPNTSTVTQYPLFYGTADRWQTTWTAEAGDRQTKLVATDPTKNFVKLDQPGLANPIDSNQTPLQRINSILVRFGWMARGGSYTEVGTSTAKLQGTTYAQTAWELVNRVMDDELGFIYFKPRSLGSTSPGDLVGTNRTVWSTRPPPYAIQLGCGTGLTDIVVDAVPASFDSQLRNAAYASRSGGTMQTYKKQSSIDRFGEQSLQRTDLGLLDENQVLTWAQAIVNFGAYPQTTLDRIVLRADVAPAPWTAWQQVLAAALITSLVRVVFDAAGYTVDTTERIVGWTHKITASEWSVEWRCVSSTVDTAGVTFHMGPHAQDRLDAGFVLA